MDRLRQAPAPVRMPRFGLFALGSRHGERFRMPFERRPFDKLCFVSEGEGFLDHDGGEAALAPGQLAVVRAGARHRFRDRPGAPMTLHVLCIDRVRLRPDAATARAWAALRRRARRPWAVGDAYARAQVLRRMRALLFEQTSRRRHFELALRASLGELLVIVLRAEPAPQAARGQSPRFRGTLAWLRAHFHEPVRIAALAAMAGTSYRSYTAHFRRATGETVASFVTGLRLEYARRRLAAGGRIADAALDAGFQDLSHFYRLFRRRFGQTPGAARYTARP